EDVAVHHSAVRGQRVQADHRGHRLPVLRQGELADEGQTVGGVQLERLATGGQDGGTGDLHGSILPASGSAVPAGPVPVPPLLERVRDQEARRLGGPHHQVRGGGRDRLIAAGAP